MSSEIRQKQFSDLPVPAGFRILQDSYAGQSGSFRQGILIYEGTLPPGEVNAYLIERLPEHGWALENESATGGVTSSVFRKGNTRAHCKMWWEKMDTDRDTAKDPITRLEIELETKK